MVAVAPLRVAIIGCGRMGTERANRAVEAGASIIAVAEEDAERGRSFASSRPGSAWVGKADALPWNELDAAFLCTPPSERSAAIDRAIRSSTALFMEKPVGLNAREGRDFAEAAGRAGIVNAVGYMNRCRRSVRAAKAALEGRSIAAVVAHWACAPYRVDWWSDPGRSGGPFNEQATHLVDLCRYLAGEVVDTRALGSRSARDLGADTRVAGLLRFESGALGTLAYTCDAAEKNIAIDVITESGSLRLSGWDFALTANTIDGATCEAESDVFAVETRMFLAAAAAHDQASVVCGLDDAARTQSVVDALMAHLGG